MHSPPAPSLLAQRGGVNHCILNHSPSLQGRALRNSPVGYFSEGARLAGSREGEDKGVSTCILMSLRLLPGLKKKRSNNRSLFNYHVNNFSLHLVIFVNLFVNNCINMIVLLYICSRNKNDEIL